MWFSSCFKLLLLWLLPLSMIGCALNCELKYGIPLKLFFFFKISNRKEIKTTHFALPQSYDSLSSLDMIDCPWLKNLFINPKLKYIPDAFLLISRSFLLWIIIWMTTKKSYRWLWPKQYWFCVHLLLYMEYTLLHPVIICGWLKQTLKEWVLSGLCVTSSAFY